MNFTENYELPLYEENDKLNVLVTGNETMRKIDTAMKANSELGNSNKLAHEELATVVESQGLALDNVITKADATAEEVQTMHTAVNKNTEDITDIQSNASDLELRLTALENENSNTDVSATKIVTATLNSNGRFAVLANNGASGYVTGTDDVPITIPVCVDWVTGSSTGLNWSSNADKTKNHIAVSLSEPIQADIVPSSNSSALHGCATFDKAILLSNDHVRLYGTAVTFDSLQNCVIASDSLSDFTTTEIFMIEY